MIDSSNLVPGVMRCAKCDFQLVRVTLAVNLGRAIAGSSDTEPCPNGCGPLWPVTWEQYARQMQDAADQMAERAIAAEKKLEALMVPGGAGFLQADDYHLLHRFIETTDDDESYDIGKVAVKRLAELGVVSNHGFGRYGVTAFGYWAHERYWEQNPILPLKTNSDRDAERRAARSPSGEPQP